MCVCKYFVVVVVCVCWGRGVVGMTLLICARSESVTPPFLTRFCLVAVVEHCFILQDLKSLSFAMDLVTPLLVQDPTLSDANFFAAAKV